MHGLYLLWWVQGRQIPAAVVASLMAVGELALVVLEVPTGWLADRLGHRTSLIVGSCVQVAGMLACWLATDATGVLGAQLLVALGDALRSGADEALLYRTCVALDTEPSFQRITARTRTFELAAQVALIIVGGALVRTIGYSAGWIAEVACSAIGVALACAFREPPAEAASVDDSVPSSRRGGLSRLMVALIAPVALMAGFQTIGLFLTQTGDDDPTRITGAVAVIVLAEAAGAAVAARMQGVSLERDDCRRYLWVLDALAVLTVVAFAAGAFTPIGIAGATIVMSFCGGIAEPLRAAAIQRTCADDERARAASLASACDKAASIAALLLINRES